jgi:hypothetical protein
MRHLCCMPAPTADRQVILAIAARVDCDPRTVRRHLRGERVTAAIAHAIEAARADVERPTPPAERAAP